MKVTLKLDDSKEYTREELADLAHDEYLNQVVIAEIMKEREEAREKKRKAAEANQETIDDKIKERIKKYRGAKS